MARPSIYDGLFYRALKLREEPSKGSNKNSLGPDRSCTRTLGSRIKSQPDENLRFVSTNSVFWKS